MFVVTDSGEGRMIVSMSPEDKVSLNEASSLAGVGTVEFIRQAITEKIAAAKQPGGQS